MTPVPIHLDPLLDLVMERTVEVPPALLWRGWTVPEQLVQWFTPAPWQTVNCEIDLRPGGRFKTVMRGPEGPEFTNVGCILEVIENRRFAWTGALAPDFRPRTQADAAADPFQMTAFISFEPQGSGTRYSAVVTHADAEARKQHERMGFHAGWGKAFDQLLALIKTGGEASAGVAGKSTG